MMLMIRREQAEDLTAQERASPTAYAASLICPNGELFRPNTRTVLNFNFVTCAPSASRPRRSALLTFMVLLLGQLASAATYYVSTAGSDSNPGTLAAPFLTLQ